MAKAKTDETIVAYKAFNADWTCRGYQFKVGETFTHEGPVAACEGGFHACERPLDVLAYYPPAGSRFAVVEQSGDLSRHSDDTKVASRHIAIKAELSLAELIKLSIDWTFSRALPVDPESPASSTGYSGAASATGIRGAASATGDSGAASATGQHSVALASGFYGRAMASESNAIVLVNRNDDGSIRHIRAAKVGDCGIKAGVWYSLDDAGNFVEV